jgi:hypothetical protein
MKDAMLRYAREGPQCRYPSENVTVLCDLACALNEICEIAGPAVDHPLERVPNL